MNISVLCTMPGSNYYRIPNLDCWDVKRNAFNFTGSNPVITHAPCPQWSRMKAFAKYNQRDRLLAYFCWDVVNTNGGIFEHPAGSSFFNHVGADWNKIISIDQMWFGFPARKRTYLYFNKCIPLQYPISFDCPVKLVEYMSSSMRSRQPLSLCKWLVDCADKKF